MIKNLGLNKTLWALTAGLSLAAGLAGVLRPQIYAKLMEPKWLPGTISQDIITIALAAATLILVLRTREGDHKKQLLILGSMGYLFYAYGIWVIERMYNVFYLLYIAIFGLSFYTIVYGVASMRREHLERVRLGKLVRNLSVGWSLLSPLVFYPLWVSQLWPLMRTGAKIETTYSIYILDLCFVMPALVIAAVLILRNRGLGLVLAPALFVKGFAMLFSVALGGIIAPYFGRTASMGEVWFYLALASAFLVMTIIHLAALRVDPGSARA